MTVTDRCGECNVTNRRHLERAVWIVVHKTSIAEAEEHNPVPVPDAQLDAVALANAFCRGPMGAYTSNLCPYHGLTLTDGRSEQAIPLDLTGAHAHLPEYNHESLSWAYVGEHATTQQYRSIVRVCRALVMLTAGAVIVGHSAGHHADLLGRLPPDASADPGKVCPAASFDVMALRRDVLDALPSDWRSWSQERVCNLLKAEGFRLAA